MPLPKASNIFVSNSFFIFIARFFPSLANLLVMIWYSRHLPQELYGSYQLFWIQLYVIYPIICFGIHALIITYSRNLLANILSRIKKKHYIIFCCWIFGISAIFAWLQHDASSISFITSFLFILTFSVSIITETLLIVFRKYILVSVTGILYAIAFCVIHWYGLSDTFSLQLIFTCLLIINLLRVFTYSCAILAEVKKDTEGYEHEDLDIPTIRSLWIHLGIYDIVQMLSSWIDKFVISLLLTAELSAIYYNGAQNIPFLPLLLSAAGSAVLLQLATNKFKNETENTVYLVNQSGRILSCIVFPVFFFLLFFRNELIVTLLSEKYIPAIPIFAVYILILPVRAYSFTTVLQRRHKGNVINAGAIAELLLACALMYPLYQLLGLPGVALSFVISTYLQAAFYLIYTGKLLGVNPLTLIPVVNWLVKLIIFAAISISIHYVGIIYYTGKFTLILGAVGMVLLVAVSLLIELNRKKPHGNVAPASFEEH
jgi:O-antigen/teichoic acid export membrane protein